MYIYDFSAELHDGYSFVDTLNRKKAQNNTQNTVQ